jgi:NADP-dependent 3-hydroxy acid dehydrogenase YdfG
MKKLVLITGGTKGIGAAIANNLSTEYEVVTVGRSPNATVSGDLRNKFFREYLLEKYDPYIFINNAASLYHDPYKMLEINGTVPVELLLNFYEKMKEGIIINISSQSAERHVRPKEELTRSLYALGKKHLKEVSLGLNYSKNKPIKVMCLSPAATHTEMLEHITDYKPKEEDYTNYNWENSVAWTKPEEVANMVRWLIDLPPHIVIPELVLDNHYSSATYW